MKIAGFSLLEIIVVVAILSILAWISLGSIDGIKKRSMLARANADLSAIRVALDLYRAEFTQYPQVQFGSDEERCRNLLTALRGQRGVGGLILDSPVHPFISEEHLVLNDLGNWVADPWGNPYYYAYSDEWTHGQYFLFSKGSDGLYELDDSVGHYDQAHLQNLDNLEGLF